MTIVYHATFQHFMAFENPFYAVIHLFCVTCMDLLLINTSEKYEDESHFHYCITSQLYNSFNVE